MKAAELCAGYGGLALAVEHVFGAETAWVSEFEDAPSRILAYHWPDIPNHGDMTKIDWAAVEPVEIISGGTPCQDLSAAGKRAGMTEGTRSNLWVQMREAIAIIKPTYVVWENVRGAYSAGAYSEMEQQEGRVGEDGNPYLRALGRVLGDLSDLGYDCQWRGLRAADVGAPHGRFRVFVLATRKEPANSYDAGPQGPHDSAGTTPSGRRGHLVQGARGHTAQDADLTTGGEWRIPTPGPEEGGRAWTDTGGRGGAPTADTDGGDDDGRVNVEERGTIQRAPTAGGSDVTASNTSGSTLGQLAVGSSTEETRAGDSDGSGDHRGERPATDWGPYESAIRRWEQALGRRAPAPTEPTGRNGAHRLSARFCEWMMGVPDGWICDVPGISRNDALKAAGNGVVVHQAVAALTDMLRAT